MNDCDPGSSFEGGLEWAAATAPKRGRKAGPRPGAVVTELTPHERRTGWALIAGISLTVGGLLVWGAVERAAEEPEPARLEVPEWPSSTAEPRQAPDPGATWHVEEDPSEWETEERQHSEEPH